MKKAKLIKIRRSQVNAFQNKCRFRVGHGYNVENAKIEKKAYTVLIRLSAQSAYLIWGLSGWALIRGRALIKFSPFSKKKKKVFTIFSK